MKKIIYVISTAIIFSACSGSNEQSKIRNKGYEPNNSGNLHSKPQENDSIVIPRPDREPKHEIKPNQDIKWI